MSVDQTIRDKLIYKLRDRGANNYGAVIMIIAINYLICRLSVGAKSKPFLLFISEYTTEELSPGAIISPRQNGIQSPGTKRQLNGRRGKKGD